MSMELSDQRETRQAIRTRARIFERLRPAPNDLWIFLTIFLGSVAIRLPFRAHYLVNWDSVNFARGTRAFNLLHHQPHPPGYIGYVEAGSLLNHFTGNPNASLTLISVAGGAVASAFLYLLAAQFMRKRYAVATAVLFSLSPVVWYYSEVALTYVVEGAVATGFVWTAYEARRRHSARYLLAATLMLVLAGSIRQSSGAFLLPLWVYVALPFARKTQVKMLAVLVVGNLSWLVPLLWLSGGPVAYVRQTIAMMDVTVGPVSIFSLNQWGLLRNVGFILGGILAAVNIGFIAILLAQVRGLAPIRRLLRHDRTFFLLWAGPALLTFLLVHTGQLGYVILLLPIAFLWVGVALDALALHRAWRIHRAPTGTLRRAWPAVALVVALMMANIGGFIYLPEGVYAFSRTNDASFVKKLTVNTSGEPTNAAAVRARQYDLALNDAHWRDMLDLIHQFNPTSTAVLAIPDGAGSYRQLAYYLDSRYRVFGVGQDESGKFGLLYAAEHGQDDYTVEGLQHARSTLALPEQIRQVVIPDPGAYQQLSRAIPHYTVTLGDGSTVVVALVRPDTTLSFVATSDGGSQIRD